MSRRALDLCDLGINILASLDYSPGDPSLRLGKFHPEPEKSEIRFVPRNDPKVKCLDGVTCGMIPNDLPALLFVNIGSGNVRKFNISIQHPNVTDECPEEPLTLMTLVLIS